MGEKKFHCKACGIDCPFNGNVKPCVTCPDAAPNAEIRAEEKWGSDIDFGSRHILTASFIEDVYQRGTGKKLGTVMIGGGRFSFR